MISVPCCCEHGAQQHRMRDGRAPGGGQVPPLLPARRPAAQKRLLQLGLFFALFDHWVVLDLAGLICEVFVLLADRLDLQNVALAIF